MKLRAFECLAYCPPTCLWKASHTPYEWAESVLSKAALMMPKTRTGYMHATAEPVKLNIGRPRVADAALIPRRSRACGRSGTLTMHNHDAYETRRTNAQGQARHLDKYHPLCSSARMTAHNLHAQSLNAEHLVNDALPGQPLRTARLCRCRPPFDVSKSCPLALATIAIMGYHNIDTCSGTCFEGLKPVGGRLGLLAYCILANCL